jgi:hypothetical protein
VTGQVEIEIVGDCGFTIDRRTGETSPWQGVRVRHRPVGVRRWSKFLVEAPAGQTLLETIAVAIAVVNLDDETRAHLARSGQLRLDEVLA